MCVSVRLGRIVARLVVYFTVSAVDFCLRLFITFCLNGLPEVLPWRAGGRWCGYPTRRPAVKPRTILVDGEFAHVSPMFPTLHSVSPFRVIHPSDAKYDICFCDLFHISKLLVGRKQVRSTVIYHSCVSCVVKHASVYRYTKLETCNFKETNKKKKKIYMQ